MEVEWGADIGIETVMNRRGGEEEASGACWCLGGLAVGGRGSRSAVRRWLSMVVGDWVVAVAMRVTVGAEVVAVAVALGVTVGGGAVVVALAVTVGGSVEAGARGGGAGRGLGPGPIRPPETDIRGAELARLLALLTDCGEGVRQGWEGVGPPVGPDGLEDGVKQKEEGGGGGEEGAEGGDDDGGGGDDDGGGGDVGSDGLVYDVGDGGGGSSDNGGHLRVLLSV
jgi:hypothetical protein